MEEDGKSIGPHGSGSLQVPGAVAIPEVAAEDSGVAAEISGEGPAVVAGQAVDGKGRGVSVRVILLAHAVVADTEGLRTVKLR